MNPEFLHRVTFCLFAFLPFCLVFYPLETLCSLRSSRPSLGMRACSLSTWGRLLHGVRQTTPGDRSRADSGVGVAPSNGSRIKPQSKKPGGRRAVFGKGALGVPSSVTEGDNEDDDVSSTVPGTSNAPTATAAPETAERLAPVVVAPAESAPIGAYGGFSGFSVQDPDTDGLTSTKSMSPLKEDDRDRGEAEVGGGVEKAEVEVRQGLEG